MYELSLGHTNAEFGLAATEFSCQCVIVPKPVSRSRVSEVTEVNSP